VKKKEIHRGLGARRNEMGDHGWGDDRVGPFSWGRGRRERRETRGIREVLDGEFQRGHAERKERGGHWESVSAKKKGGRVKKRKDQENVSH
jgi:hypothetical protein